MAVLTLGGRAGVQAGEPSCLCTIHTRDWDRAEAFLRKAIRTQGVPEKITIDQSGGDTAAITHYNRTHKTTITIRQGGRLNNVVEQAHRAIKRLTHSLRGFQSLWASCCTIAGMEVMRAVCKGQLATLRTASQTPAEQFCAVAA